MFTERSGVFSITAIMNTSTPMPPTQCVKLRQNNRPWPSASTSVRIDAPVVVKPETVSKNASINDGILPLMTNGNAPNSDIPIHDRATIASPSRVYRFLLSLRQKRLSAAPIAAEEAADIANASAQLSP